MNDFYKIRIDVSPIADIYAKNLTEISDLIRSTLDSFALAQFSPDVFDGIHCSLLKITDSLADSLWNSNSDSFRDIRQKLDDLFKTLTIPSFEVHSVLNDISIDGTDVTLTDDAVEKITDFLTENTETPVVQIANKMSKMEFVTNVLIPLLLSLFAMIQTSYYHHVDSIESQQQQLQESAFQAQLLDIETQRLEEEKLQTAYLEQLIQLLEDCLSESPEAIQESLDTTQPDSAHSPTDRQKSVPTPETSEESPAAADATPDVPDIHNTDE